MRVALATCAELPELDDDAPALRAALRTRGVESAAGVWDDPAVAWAGFDLVVLRSTWDYAPRREAFLAWAERVATVTTLLNPVDVVRWNTDKRYLRALAAAGVPVVATEWVEPGGALPDLADFVVKPAVSCGCRDTRRFEAGEREAAQRMVERLHAEGRAVMVQPYLAHIDADAETALLYIGDRYSHAIRKGPMLALGAAAEAGLFRAEDIGARVASDAQLAVAEAALDAVPGGRARLLYARVDVVPGPDGRPVVLELELTEPSLFLGFADGAAERFAAAISAACERAATG